MIDEVGDETARAPEIAAPQKRHRLIRYGLLAAGTGVAAVTLFLVAYAVHIASLRPDPENLILLTDSSLTPGTRAAARIVLRNHDSGEPLANERILVRLMSTTDAKAYAKSWTLETGPDGVADLDFLVPEWPDGPCVLVARPGEEKGEREAVVRTVQVRRPFKVFLSTDKPIYQPGQKIRIRLLAMFSFRKKPLADEPACVEVRNPQGIKVFQKELKTSAFGLASVAMPLATELDLGAYRITAKVRGVETGKTVHVKRYVLPKFKVEIRTDKSHYLPGESVNVEVKATYLFGKPVAGARVSLVGRGHYTVLETSGETDAEGRFRFSGRVKTQEAFPWDSRWEGRKAVMNLDAEVTDTAGHVEKMRLEVPIVREPYDIALYPEGGRIAPGVENRFFFILTLPDGRPCKARVVLTGETLGTRELETDEHGVADFSLVCKASDPLALRCTIHAPGAGSFTKEFSLGKSGFTVPFLLRPDRSVYAVGDTATLTVLTPGPSPETLYLDVVRDGQTVLMRRVNVAGGKGEMAIDLDAELRGLLNLRLYRINERGTAERDTRFIFVRDDSELNVRIRMDREVYRPGDRARAIFELKGPDGEPRTGALSLCAVDEAVFALTEIRPGFLETLFQIDEAFLSPRYRVQRGKSLPIREMVSGPDAPAGAAFSALTPFVEAPAPPPSSYQNKRRAVEAEKRDKRAFLGKAFALSVGIVALLLFFGLPPLALFFYSERSPWAKVIGGGWALLFLLMCFLFSIPVMFVAGGGGLSARRAAPDAGVPQSAEPPDSAPSGVGGLESPRVRRDFPETLLWVPELLTDEKGHAEFDFPLADSITTWRLTAQAVTPGSGLGSSVVPIRVFQDFFVDLDLPAELTRNDEIELHAVVYNYLETRETVRLVLEAKEGVEILGPAEAELTPGPGEVLSAVFRIRATRVGRWRLLLRGFGRNLSDAVEREIRVVPDGRAVVQATSDLLGEEAVEIEFAIPAETIPDSSTAVLKFYPGPGASAVEGLEKLVRMPHGCFEQSASLTYPNILVKGYLRAAGSLAPETAMKLDSALAAGYQRLLSFRSDDGGFHWYGGKPAGDLLLTAYGLWMLSDLAREYPVDPLLIRHLQTYLTSRQAPNGSWSYGSRGGEGPRGTGNDTETVTAYVALALAESGYRAVQLHRAVRCLQDGIDDDDGPFLLAFKTLLFLSQTRYREEADVLLEKLAAASITEGDVTFWKPGAPGVFGSCGMYGSIEATGLAVQCFAKAKKVDARVTRALVYLVRKKDARGTWGSTQATVQALKALLAVGGGAGLEGDGVEVVVSLDGEERGKVEFTRRNADVLRILDLSPGLGPGAHRLKLSPSCPSGIAFQFVAKHFVPEDRIRAPAPGALDLSVEYDRDSLAVGEVLAVHATVKYKRKNPATMVIVDIGIPPGFEPVRKDLDDLVFRTVIGRYTLQPRRATFYLSTVKKGQPIRIDFGLRARKRVRASIPPSSAYEYYDPDNRDDTPAGKVEVK